MFVERLAEVTRRIEGARSLSLVAKDGIPVESVEHAEGLDLEILAAELMSQVRAISQNNEELAVGDVRHLSVTTDEVTMMVTALTEDYFLLLVQDAAGNRGRARFELRRAVLLFAEDLL